MPTPITIVGNLIAEPELRFTQGGKSVANLTVAVNNRTKNDATGEWEDGDPDFYNVTVWDKEGAENVAESLTKGVRVIVTGDYKSRRYETKDGDKRTAWDLTAREIGPALRWATAQVTRTGRDTNTGGGQRTPQSGQGDPWAAQETRPAPTATQTRRGAQDGAQPQQGDGYGGHSLENYTEPPF